jgi:branched-chain amino acid transport system substrate-binding protein
MDAAVTAVKGKVEDKNALVAAMRNVKFDSIRGPFRYGKNHFPVQSFYATEVVRQQDGKLIEANRGLIVKDDVDAYVGDCQMK